MKVSLNRFGDIRPFPMSLEQDVVYLFCEREIGNDIQLGRDVLRWLNEGLPDGGEVFIGQDFTVSVDSGMIFLSSTYGTHLASEFEALTTEYLAVVERKGEILADLSGVEVVAFETFERVCGLQVYSKGLSLVVIADFINEYFARGNSPRSLYEYFCNTSRRSMEGSFVIVDDGVEISVTCREGSWRAEDMVVKSGSIRKSDMLDFLGGLAGRTKQGPALT